MTNSLNCSNHRCPEYSGITINITNPSLNTNPTCDCNNCNPYKYSTPINQAQPYINTNYANDLHQAYPASQVPSYNTPTISNPELLTNPNIPTQQDYINNPTKTYAQNVTNYPPQYYLNNYNYTNNTFPNNANTLSNNLDSKEQKDLTLDKNDSTNKSIEQSQVESNVEEADLSISKNIIDNLEAREAAEKEAEANSKQTKVVALTNEYIMSLENYLNNPNKEIRIMATKEILTRLNEDTSRYDDAALNALLNKMLQDPEKIVRIAALSAFSSKLASGNDFTVKLLKDIQNNPKADKEDAVVAANILLQMSSTTEIKSVPTEIYPANNQEEIQTNQ